MGGMAVGRFGIFGKRLCTAGNEESGASFVPSLRDWLFLLIVTGTSVPGFHIPPLRGLSARNPALPY
jgi:hypothetical protein